MLADEYREHDSQSRVWSISEIIYLLPKEKSEHADASYASK